MSPKRLIKNTFFLIGFALLVKVGILAYLIHGAKQNETYRKKFITSYVVKYDDYGYFIQPVENYVTKGVMYYTAKDKPFAGRMPGYWFPYLLLRYIFSADASITILITLQILLAALSVYFLAKTSYNIYKTEFSFYFTYFLFLITPYTISFDIGTQSESFAVSASIFYLFFLSNFFCKGQRKMDLVLSGFFLAWCIFLRPFMGISIVVVALILIVFAVKEKKGIRQMAAYLMLFCSAFIVFEICWMYRNYVALRRIIPLETPVYESYGKLYSDAWEQIVFMIVTFGEKSAYFEPGTLAEWFKRSSVENFSFDEKLFKNVPFTKDSLILLKEKYQKFKKETDPAKELELEQYCITTAKRYNAAYEQQHFFKVNFINPVIRTKNYVFNSGSSYLLLPSYNDMSWHQKILKLIASFTYYLTIISGLIAIMYILIKRKFSYMNIVLISSVIVGVLVIVLLSEIQENRYLMPTYPCFVLLSAAFFNNLRNKKKNENSLGY